MVNKANNNVKMFFMIGVSTTRIPPKRPFSKPSNVFNFYSFQLLLMGFIVSLTHGTGNF
jgi:hypothetical protein